MKQRCKESGAIFDIDDEDLAFYHELGVPPPTRAPLERLRRRISFRNFRNLYHRTCSASGARILSMYESGAPFPVFANHVWWEDSWDARDFGRDMDFSKPFFEQYNCLAREVPHYAIMNLKCENCEYSNFAFESKNCYLVFGCVRNEDCFYGHIVWDCKDCLDCLYAYRCELCSHSVDIVDCYNVHYSVESTNCSDSYFLYDCRNCRNCFGCINLRNCEFCFFGEQCSREEYLSRMAQLLPLSLEAVNNSWNWLRNVGMAQAAHPEYYGLNNDAVSGNHIYDSKGLYQCFDAKQCEDSRYLYTAWGSEQSADLSFVGGRSRSCVEGLTLSNAERVFYSHLVHNSYDIYYSEHCYSSHDLFGCHGLRNAAYCILNRQHSKEDYLRLRHELLAHMQAGGEWGEFFPAALSPFAYNESIAHEYIPLTRDEVLKRGLRWKEDMKPTEGSGTVSLPYQRIEEVGDNVLQQRFWCGEQNKAFKFIAPELELYRKLQLPLPNCSPDARHQQRMAVRFPRVLLQGQCCGCGVRIQSAHLQAATPRVLCESCYERVIHHDDGPTNCAAA